MNTGLFSSFSPGEAKDFVLPIRYFSGAKRLEAVSLVPSGDPRFDLEVVKILQQFDQRDIYLQIFVPEDTEPCSYQVPRLFSLQNPRRDRNVSLLSQCVEL